MAYRTRNPRTPDVFHSNPPVPVPERTHSGTLPWLVSDCNDRDDANRILQSCPSIQTGNFLVRHSASKTAKYTISVWFNGMTTHIRIQQLVNGNYRVEFEEKSKSLMPEFASLERLIDFYSNNPMKLVGHCEGSVKLKYNPEVFSRYNLSLGGIVTYGP